MIRSRLARAGAGALVVLAGILAFAAPAFAHAQLLGTSPASGAVLASPPRAVVLTFGETVQAPPGAIEVYSADGQQVRTGPVEHPGGQGSQVSVTLPASMEGTYVVSWRVISADTHPVQGAFTFSVGAPSAGAGVGSLEQHLLASRHPSRALGVLTGALRTLILLAVIVAVGGAALLVGWPAGVRLRAVRDSILVAASLTAVATIAAVVAQGPYDAGRPLGEAFRPNVLSPVLHSSFGTGAWVRVAGSAVMLAGLFAGFVATVRGGPAVEPIPVGRRGTGGDAIMPTGTGAGGLGGGRGGKGRGRSAVAMVPVWLMAILVGAAALVVSLSLSGHATTGRWQRLGFIADLVHVSAGAVWVGGLLVLAGVLFEPGPHVEADELERVLRRFSATALLAVAAIVVSGVFQSWRQVGSWGQLTETDYGTVLLLKVTLVVAAVEAGWFSRRWVNRRFQPVPGHVPPDPSPASGTAVGDVTPATGAAIGRPPGPGAATASGDLAGGQGSRGAPPAGPGHPAETGGRGPATSRFRRWLAFEAAIGIGIVALTGVLIDSAPPQGERAAAATRAFTARSTIAPGYLMSVAVYPLVPGTVTVGIQLTNRATVPVDAYQVTAQLELPARKIGPLPTTLNHQSTGSWVANNVEIPLPGRWQLLVSVLTDPITEVDTAFHFRIYG